MIRRARHLREERLFDCYLAVRSGEGLDPPVAEHLTDCADCGERYAELTQFMESLDREATAESDDAFTPERLRAQQQHIARRLEHLGHAARVISFPGCTAAHAAGCATPRTTRRWIAAAAAAGLFIGVGAGLVIERDASRPVSEREGIVVRQVDPVPPARIQVSFPGWSEEDDAFLWELTLAGERPRIRELLAVDALTPHAREVTLR